MLNFPEFSSKQMSHYIDIHKSIDTVIVYVGVNDLLNLIWVGFLGVRFDVMGGCKITTPA